MFQLAYYTDVIRVVKHSFHFTKERVTQSKKGFGMEPTRKKDKGGEASAVEEEVTMHGRTEKCKHHMGCG